jgi:dienelactone hydrolase
MDELNARIGEQAVLLGSRQSLVGILTRPVPSGRSDDGAIVFLNTGVIHRVGHHRMFVTMARALARSGRMALRFDLSGIGDSEPRLDGLSPVEACLADIKDALDWLEQERQVRKVVLVGLCSGADHAILYGHTDPRVVGLVLMDPTIPATARYYLDYVSERLTRLPNWLNVLAGRSRILRVAAEQLLHILRPGRRARHITLQDLQFHPYLEESYRNTVARGLRILAVFTPESTRQTYREQILDAFPLVAFGDLLELEFLHGSDHTFSREQDRAKLIGRIFQWLGPADRDEERCVLGSSEERY